MSTKYLREVLHGGLMLIGYYEILCLIGVPFTFTVSRVTRYYVFQIPLLGSIPFDAALVTILMLLSMVISLKVFKPIFYFVGMIISSVSLVVILLNPLASYLVLAIAVIPPLYIYVKRCGWVSIFRGFLYALTIMSIASLVACISYYLLGYWSSWSLGIVLRNRLVWSIAEWAVPSLLILYLINTLYYLVKRKPLYEMRLGKFAGTLLISKESMLIISIILVVVIITLPHIPTVNPEFKPVSVDTYLYAKYLYLADEVGPLQALREYSRGRPLYMLALYYLWLAVGKRTVVFLDYIHPLIAIILLVFASYYLARKFYGENIAPYAALLSVIGVHTVSFIAGGYQANSIALPLALIALTITPTTITNTILLSLMLIAVGIIHPWTYTMYSVAIFIHSLITKRKETVLNTFITLMLSYVVIHIIDSILAQVIPLQAAAQPLKVGMYLPHSIYHAFQLEAWGTLLNPALIIMLFLSIPRFNPLSTLSALITPIIPLVPRTLVQRIVLNLPISIEASKTTTYLTSTHVFLLIIIAVRTIESLTGLTPLNI